MSDEKPPGSMDDLPLIDPANRSAFDSAMREFLGLVAPEKGVVIYSEKMAQRLARRLIDTHKKAPARYHWLAEALTYTPALDRMVATAIRNYRNARSVK